MGLPKHAERRKVRRARHLTEVACEGAGKRQTCRITDLSTTGAFVETAVQYPPGSRVRLRFRIDSRVIEVTGEVRYAEPRIGMGVAFLDLSPEGERAIEAVAPPE